jgi:curved DNA-binding protein CbpA
VAQNATSSPGGTKRRSTRIRKAVPLKVNGRDTAGQPFQEETATLELGFQGCRYFSNHRVRENTWLTLEIPGQSQGGKPLRLRARVAWTRSARWLPGVFQIGVELESPGNVWGVAAPPENWVVAAPASEIDAKEFEREVTRLLGVAATGNYYQLLGVSGLATPSQLRASYHRLARRFHPDLHMARGESMAPLRKVMEELALAYKTLSDEKLRRDYDRRLSELGGFTLGHRKTEEQKSAEECFERARECLRARNYPGSIGWLRKCVSLAPDSSRYHALLARTLAAVPQYRDEAIEHFEKSIELDPLNTLACLQLAELFTEMELGERARPLYRKVLEIDPENSKAGEGLRGLDLQENKRNKRGPGGMARLFQRK